MFDKYLIGKDKFFVVALEAAATISKSTAIAIALLDEFVSIEKAVECLRFEENVNMMEFGKVEGTHDVDESYETMVISAAKNLVKLSIVN